MPSKSPIPSQSSKSGYHVGMFSAGEARCDRWQELSHTLQALSAQASAGRATADSSARTADLLAVLEVFEAFHAYPGETLMQALSDSVERGDWSAAARLSTRIAKAVITGSFRRSVSAWKPGEEAEGESSDRLLKDYFDTGDLTKPYFEVLMVSDEVRDTLRLEGLEEKVGRINRFTSVADAADEFRHADTAPASANDPSPAP